MNETCTNPASESIQAGAPQGGKTELRFKKGDCVKFVKGSYETAIAYANSGLGYEEFAIAGIGPHRVSETRYDENGDPQVALHGYGHFKYPFFHQNLFEKCGETPRLKQGDTVCFKGDTTTRTVALVKPGSCDHEGQQMVYLQGIKEMWGPFPANLFEEPLE